jgi:hypothetical protein
LTLESVKAIVACNHIYRLATVTARRTARPKTRTSCSIASRVCVAEVHLKYFIDGKVYEKLIHNRRGRKLHAKSVALSDAGAGSN